MFTFLYFVLIFLCVILLFVCEYYYYEQSFITMLNSRLGRCYKLKYEYKNNILKYENKIKHTDSVDTKKLSKIDKKLTEYENKLDKIESKIKYYEDTLQYITLSIDTQKD